MRSVAIGAGVSTMNVYSRFGSKDGLLDVIYREGFETLGRRLGAIVEPDLPSEIRAFAATYRAFALEHPARYELMFGGEGRGFRPTAASSEVARGVLAAIAARLHASEPSGASSTCHPASTPSRSPRPCGRSATARSPSRRGASPTASSTGRRWRRPGWTR
jgi:AcrR family transcriptional regulator